MRIKLIYGSDTGNTELITADLVKLLDKDEVEVKTVDEIAEDDWLSHPYYLLGIPTWYDGELQSDWEDYFNIFKSIDFTGKNVAVFGLGDQLGYEEWFCDGVGILAKVVSDNGGNVIGLTDKDDSYDFESSKAVFDENTLWGLCLDEDNQDDLTEERVENWVEKLKLEYNNK